MTQRSTKAIVAFLSILAVFGLGYTLSTYAATTGSLIDALGGSTTTFGQGMTTSGVTSTSVEIVFPVYSSNGQNITNFEVNYVKGKSISTADISEVQKATFSSDKVQVANGKVTLKLAGLSPSTSYYYVVTPINNEGGMLSPSDEQTFTTIAGSTTTTTTPATTDATLGAADLSTANFTYTISGSKVTVKWNAIQGANKFVFSQKEATASTYSNIGEEVVSKEAYSFVLGKVGLYSVKIVPTDSNGTVVGAEKILTVKVTSVTPATTGKGTPATGPMLNLVLMSTFLLMLVYVVYRFRTTK